MGPLPVKSYENFDLLIDRRSPGLYRASVVRGPVEGGQTEFDHDGSAPDLSGLLRTKRLRDLERRAKPGASIPPQAWGDDLFRSVFSGEVGTCWDKSLSQAKTLRLRLRLKGVPELSPLPWELLYDARTNEYLALSRETPVIRYLEIPEPIEPLKVRLPLRILVVIAGPSGCPRLNAEKEWNQIGEVLAPLAGRVVVKRLESATLPALSKRLQQERFHVLHFIGHGGFQEAQGDGVLLFENDRGRAEKVTGQKLGTLLSEYPKLRLVVLNACEGGRSSESEPFSGVAQGLVQHRVPAVVAMQSKVRDRAAIAFSRHFYGDVAKGQSLEVAVTRARRELHFEEEKEGEWCAPVLYLRGDGKIFTVRPGPQEAVALLVLLLVASLSWLGLSRVSGTVPQCPSPPDLEMKLVPIPSGKFLMGRGRGKATYQHEVTLTNPLCMGAHEVTQEQWRMVLGESPSAIQGESLPVESVTWDRVQDFLAKLNEREPGANCRLPTEAEWEYAARAGTETDFFFGNDPAGLSSYGNCKGGDERERTTPVGSFEPNLWGLYDMYGNVSEWVADWEEDYPKELVKDPPGPGQGTKRVRRGGAWDIEPKNCNSFHRLFVQPDFKRDNTGFRIVRDPVLLSSPSTRTRNR